MLLLWLDLDLVAGGHRPFALAAFRNHAVLQAAHLAALTLIILENTP